MCRAQGVREFGKVNAAERQRRSEMPPLDTASRKDSSSVCRRTGRVTITGRSLWVTVKIEEMAMSKGESPGVRSKGYPAGNPDQEEIGRVDPAQ